MSEKLTPFDFLNAINLKANTDLDASQYNPFMVNRGLSYFQDTILWANEMNRRSHIDKDMQYAFLLNTVKKGRRFSKWFKAESDEDIDCIIEYYKVNRLRAQEILSLLNTEQINTIKEKLFKGGK